MTSSTTPKKLLPTRIKDTINKVNQGIIFKNHKALQAIYKQSGPLADSCEFQVHYWALVLRHQAEDSSILDIAIPLVYFNYKQEVSGGRIDFDMKEVNELSQKLAPIAQQEAGKLLTTNLKEDLESYFQLELTPLLAPLNTIHKHPGGSSHQAFSGTDLDTTSTDHGVVYPLATAMNNVPNFAGIMALDSGVNNTAHFEYRLVNGTLGTDIHYSQGRCLAITVKEEPKQSIIEQKMGYSKESNITVKTKFAAELEQTAADLAEIYKSNGYSPFLKAIVPENVVRAVSKYSTSTRYTFSKQEDIFDNPEPNVNVTKLPAFVEEDDLKKMDTHDLVKQLKLVDAYYLDKEIKDEDYPEELYPTRADLIDEIIDIQINILAEQPIPREEMINTLVKKGFSRASLVTKNTNSLEYLYNF